MSTDVMHSALTAWATKDLPARLDVAGTSRLLGFAENDIQILLAVGKLTPLGDPAPNAPKWFAAVAMIRLAGDQDWLHKATKELAKYWRNKRERRMNLGPSPHNRKSESTNRQTRCPTPRLSNFHPASSCEGRQGK